MVPSIGNYTQSSYFIPCYFLANPRARPFKIGERQLYLTPIFRCWKANLVILPRQNSAACPKMNIIVLTISFSFYNYSFCLICPSLMSVLICIKPPLLAVLTDPSLHTVHFYLKQDLHYLLKYHP